MSQQLDLVRGTNVRVLSNEKIQVTIAPHPFNSRKAFAAAQAGDTVAEIVAANWNGVIPCAVRADGNDVPRERWDSVCPLETVELVGVPQDPITAAIASISAAVGSLGVVGTALFNVAIGIGLQLLANLLFPPAKPSLDRDTASATYSIGGARNQTSPWGAVPVILGTHRVSPSYAASPYTELRGNDQYLRAVFCWGHGPLDISDLKIGETPLSEFDEVTTQTFNGYEGDGEPTLFPAQVFQEDLSVTLEGESEYVRTTAPDIDEIIVDLQAPRGLYRYRKSDGRRISYTATIRLLYRPAGSGSYVQFQEVTLKGSDETAIRKSYRLEVERGQYDVRVLRPSALYDGEDQISQDVIWSALRGIRNENPINADVPLALTAMRIRATAQLSGNIETFNGLVTSRVTSWNGSAWVDDQPSNNPADLFRHALTCSANKRPVAVGQIDLDQLADWHEFCTEQGYTFNQVRDFSGSVWDTLKAICAAGRAVPTFVDGKWSVVWDDPDAVVVQHFTPANSSGFQGQRAYIDMPHAFRVRFVNEQNNYLQDERVVYDDGYDETNATRFEGLEFPGVTDPDLIWKFGRYHIAQLRLRRETYNLSTDFEHLVCTRGDRVRVTHDVPKWGLGFGRVKAVSGDTITLDGDVTMEVDGDYVIRFRQGDGTSVLRSVVTDAGTNSVIELVAGGTAPEVGALYMFGVTGIESVVLRVKAIAPTADFAARLTLVDDAPAIYQADQGTIPAFDSQITEPVDLFNQPPSDLIATELSYLQDGVMLFSGAEVSWQPPPLGSPISYNIQWRNAEDAEWQPAVSVADTSYSVLQLEAGSYQLRVQAVYTSAVSVWRTVSFDIAGPYRVPDNVETFRADIAGSNIIMTWSGTSDSIVKDYEIRFSPALSGATWQSATQLVADLSGTSYVAPYAKGTYLIKARSWRNVYSADATAIVTRTEPIERLNAVETATDDPDFGGTYTDTYFDEGASGVVLQSTADFFAPDDFFDQGVVFPAERQPLGYYSLATGIDLGSVYTSHLTAALSVGGIEFGIDFFDGNDIFDGEDVFLGSPDGWAARAQVRYTDDDPSASPDWSEWEDLRISDYTARAFDFRVRLESITPSVSPLLTSAVFTVDMPDRIVAGEDLQSTASGVTITFSPAFKSLKALNVTGQDMIQGDYWTVTGKSVTGATVTFFNSAGEMVDRSFDYQAVGYGSIET